jgi:hypothetical protein
VRLASHREPAEQARNDFAEVLKILALETGRNDLAVNSAVLPGFFSSPTPLPDIRTRWTMRTGEGQTQDFAE